MACIKSVFRSEEFTLHKTSFEEGKFSMKSRNSFVSWFILFAVMLSMMMASQNIYASKAEGKLTVAGDTVQLQHAYAMAQPGFFDKTKEDIVVTVTNIPLPEKAIEDRGERIGLVSEGTLKSVEITINSKQQPISVGVKHSAFKASPSGFSSNYILELKTFDEKNVEGRMYCKTEQEFFDTAYTFDFTFKAEIHRKKKLPPPTKAEKEAAAKSHQAALYQKFAKATNDRDVETLKKVLTADVAAGLDGPDKDDMLEFMQMGNPPEIEFQRITVEGESATLMLGAQQEGQELVGKAEFVKEGDLWKLMIVNWEDK